MTPRETTRDIIEATSEGYGMPINVVMSPRRSKQVVRARYASIRAVKCFKPWLSTPELGQIFDLDHTTVLYALERLKKKPTV